jgi:hypothetical protein
MNTKYLLSKLFLVFSLMSFLSPDLSIAQSNPVALKPAIQIDRVMTVRNGVVRMVKDPVSGMLFYSNTSGNIYAILQPQAAAAYDSLIYTVADHSVQYVQGMTIHDSTLYVSGNNNSNTPLTTGIIARGKLQSNGIRTWDTLMITNPYETGDYFDHLFSGMTVSPSGDSIYICSAARGDHGEIQDRYGAYPGLRNLPLTTNIYVLPTQDTSSILLQNDSMWNDTSVYLFARGIRNTFSMAFDASGNLFGVENSGDRDHNEEMNWLRRGMHYGFPWKMGDTDNPQQFPGFDPATDSLIPHYSRSWRLGFWNNDPSFPPIPSGVAFEDPIQNIGPDADKFRDTITGEVKDASDLAISIGTFTAHRSPLGLIFDNAQTLHPAYRGDGFMLSWTKGLDSCGCTSVPDTAIGPFVDPSQDLLHLDMAFDSSSGKFQLSATRIVGDFSHPIDQVIDSNSIYVIENGYGGTSGLYKISLPVEQACTGAVSVVYADSCSKGPAMVLASSSGIPPYDFEWYQASGTLIQSTDSTYDTDTLSISMPDMYYVIMNDSAACRDSISFTISPELDLQIISSTGTSCIGCNNGVVHFTVSGATAPVIYSVTPFLGNFAGDSLSELPAGNYLICVEDDDGCIDCDSVMIEEDPSGVQGFNISNSSISIFPNPARNVLHIRLSDESVKEIQVNIFDLSGRKQVLNSAENIKIDQSRECSIDLENLATGNYVVEIGLNGKVERRMLGVRR